MNQNETRRPISARGMIIIALMLAAIAGLGHYVLVNLWGFSFGQPRDMRMTDTQKGVVYDFSASASFYNHDARAFFFCTRDGMKYVSSNGEVQWNEIYNLSKPIMDTHSGFVAVGEEKSRRVYVFDQNGIAYSVVFDNPVLTFSVNQTGYLAVVLQLDRGYAVHIYNRRHTTDPLYANIIHDPNMTPTAVSVSRDGKYAAIAVIDYGMRLSSRVLFCFVNAFDAWDTTDGMFAAVEYTDQIVYRVRFMANDKLLVFTDMLINCYTPEKAPFPEAAWSVSLHNRINPVAFYGESRFAFVTGDRFLNDPEAAEPGEVNIYDINGERTGTFRLGRRATHLSMGHDHVIVGADRSFYVLTHRGSRVWDHQTLHDTRDFIFLDNTDTVLIAGGARASIMKRERIRTGDLMTGEEPAAAGSE